MAITPELAEEHAELIAKHFKKLLSSGVDREAALELSMRYSSLLLWYVFNPPDTKQPWE